MYHFSSRWFLLQEESVVLKQVKESLALKSGIYAFVHNETHKAYIGSSINLAKRISCVRSPHHFKNLNSNIHLQRAFAKYGLKEFSLYILEFLPKDPNLSDVEHLATLIQLEQKYIDLFDEKYNINPVAAPP